MSLPDFLSGSKSIRYLTAEEKMMDSEIALLGNQVSEDYVRKLMKKFQDMTRDPKKVAEAERIRKKWAERGITIST